MLWLMTALLVFIFQIAAILALGYRKPEKTVAWLIILFIFPMIGFVVYYFTAQEYRRIRAVRAQGSPTDAMFQLARRRSRIVCEAQQIGNGWRTEHERLFQLLAHLPPYPITGRNETKILTNGRETFDAILEAIEGAKHHIHLNYYTIRNDGIGARFKEALIRKAREGVQVRIIYDGIGSMELSGAYIREMQQAGVKTRCFLAPGIALLEKRINYRNHRKIAVIDGLIGFNGGINIGDEYLGGNRKLGFWRDTHMQIKGDGVYYLQDVFIRDWWFTAAEQLNDPSYMPEHQCAASERVKIVPGGPDQRNDTILHSVFAAVSAARSRIYMSTPYFIPDSSLLTALRSAAQSGVEVRIIIPFKADTRLVMYASLSYIEAMLEAGVRVYRYKKGFMHGKVLIADRLLACVGTANMDMRSFFSNFELNALLFDESAISRLEEEFMQDIRDSFELDIESFKQRSRKEKLKEAGARLLSPLL